MSVVRMTIAIPKDVHDKLSKLAEDARRSRTAEIVVAIEDRFEAAEKAKAGK